MEFVKAEDFEHLPRPDISYKTTESLPPLAYDKLPDASSFRLLQSIDILGDVMQFSLSTFSVDSPPDYRAVSYTWGSPNPLDNLTADLTKPIVCNGSAALITENLWGFLKTVHSGECYLWIDALCINQQDLAERGQQVTKMGEIYSKAVEVIAWLGALDGPSDVAMKTIQQFIPLLKAFYESEGAELVSHNYLDPKFWTQVGREPFTDEEANALTYFFNRYWFERTWIIQEIFFAKDLILVCGLRMLDWEAVVMMSRFIYDTKLSKRWSNLRAHSMKTQWTRDVAVAPMMLEKMRVMCQDGIPINEDEKLPPLSQLADHMIERAFVLFLGLLVFVTRTFQCTRAIDKVYAPASLALYVFGGRLDPQFYVLDYTKEPYQVFAELGALLVTHKQNLEPLSFVEDRSFRVEHQLPSWVPDFGTLVTGPLIALPGQSFDCMKGLKKEPKVSVFQRGLLTRGYQFCDVAKLGPIHLVTSKWGDPKAYTPKDTTTFSINPTPWLRFAFEMNPRYPNGESFITAFVGTIIADQKGDEMSINRLLEFFHHYLVYTCVRSRDMDELLAQVKEKVGEDPSDILPIYNRLREEFPRWPILDEFEKRRLTTGTNVVPTLDQLIHWIDKFVHPGSELEANVKITDICRTFITNAHLAAITGRRLFQSDGGWIGLIPVSARKGDEVWLIPGSKVPLVLRRVPGKMLYEFLGEAYVHGIMYGEMFKDFKPELIKEMEPILII
ncbi:hypothetical protein ACEPPN_018922 [Leptodophora sp. 'Broadleaf-Isolate-01']